MNGGAQARLEQLASKCRRIGGETAFLVLMLIALGLVVLHGIIMACVSVLKQKCSSRRCIEDVVIRFGFSPYSPIALVDTGTLIVTDATAAFAARYRRTPAEMIGKRLPQLGDKITEQQAAAAACSGIQDGQQYEHAVDA